MKKILFLIFVNFVLALFQNSFFLELFGVLLNPNLVLAFAFSLIMIEKKEIALISALFGGVLLDIFGTTPLGFSSLTIVTLVYITFYIQRYLFRGSLTYIVALLLASFIYPLVVTLSLPTSFGNSFMGAVHTTTFGYIFYLLNNKYSKSTTPTFSTM